MGIVSAISIHYSYGCLCKTVESSRMACTEFETIAPVIAARVSLRATAIQDRLAPWTQVAQFPSDQHRFECDVS